MTSEKTYGNYLSGKYRFTKHNDFKRVDNVKKLLVVAVNV